MTALDSYTSDMENTLISPVINPDPPGSRTGLQKVVIATKLDSIARDILLEDGNYEVVQDESGDLAALRRQSR